MRQKTQSLLRADLGLGLKGQPEALKLSAHAPELQWFDPHLDLAMFKDEALADQRCDLRMGQREHRTWRLGSGSLIWSNPVQDQPPWVGEAEAAQPCGLSAQSQGAALMAGPDAHFLKHPDLVLVCPELKDEVAADPLHEHRTVEIQDQPIRALAGAASQLLKRGCLKRQLKAWSIAIWCDTQLLQPWPRIQGDFITEAPLGQLSQRMLCPEPAQRSLSPAESKSILKQFKRQPQLWGLAIAGGGPGPGTSDPLAIDPHLISPFPSESADFRRRGIILCEMGSSLYNCETHA